MSKPPTQQDDAVEDDAELLQRLAAIAAEIDPPPDSAYELGRQLFSLRRLDDEMAELVGDSDVDALATRTTATGVRLLSFDCTSVTLDLQVSENPAGHAVLGVIASGDDSEFSSAEVQLHSASGEIRSTTAGADGRFEFGDINPSLVRFVLRLDGVRVSTTWVRL